MTSQGRDTSSWLTPSEAFSLLGNDTRVDILFELATADGPSTFNALRKAVGVEQGAQFNYHLDKLVGHFVAKTDEGYTLRQAGRRVVMAIFSGAVTESRVIDSEVTDIPCTICHGPIEATYSEEHLRLFCTECDGHYGDDPRGVGTMGAVKPGYLGSLAIPPAAISGRSAREIYLAAATLGHAGLYVWGSGVCPECGSTVDRSVRVCEHHDAGGSICAHCDGYHPTRIQLDCDHCINTWEGRFDNCLLAETELQAFLTDHGINMINPETNAWSQFEYEEELVSTEPFEARYRFTVGDDSLTLTVGDDLEVVDAELGG